METDNAVSVSPRAAYRAALERIILWQRGRLEAAGELADELSELRVIGSLGHCVVVASAMGWWFPGWSPADPGPTHLMARGQVAYLWDRSRTWSRSPVLYELLHWDDGQSVAPDDFDLTKVPFDRPVTIVLAVPNQSNVIAFFGQLVGIGTTGPQPSGQLEGTGPYFELRPAFSLDRYPARVPILKLWMDVREASYSRRYGNSAISWALES